MMLGALLPTIANAYHRILAMVDTEMAEADRDRRLITFTLDEYGGLWGRLAEVDTTCGMGENLDGAVLEPSMWRRTVRALLRIDVYGLNSSKDGVVDPRECQGFFQVGLKDIILLLENRSKLRHDTMDAAIAAGLMQNPEHFGHRPGGPHTCQQIIAIAKHSIENLVIA